MFLSEYAHAMGNAVGNLKEYWDVMENSNRTIGGCIWDWIDQAIYDPKLLQQGIKQAYSTGYDFGGPHQGNFCSNGLLNPSRTPSAKLNEVKKVYEYVDFTNFNPSSKAVILKNKYAFLNLNVFNLKWVILKNGVSIQEGLVTNLNIEPGTLGAVTLPYNTNLIDNQNEYLLDVFLVLKEATDWAESGHSLASEQFEIIKRTDLPVVATAALTETLSIVPTTNELIISGSNFSVRFNRITSMLSSLQYDNKEMIHEQNGFVFDHFRYIENDYASGTVDYYNSLLNESLSFAVSPDKKFVTVTTQRESSNYCTYNMVYTVYSNGIIDVKTDFNVTGNPQRVGLSLSLAPGLENIDYYARGPLENYVDRKTGSFLGRYQTTVSDMQTNYVKPQTMGNREDLRVATFTDEQGLGLKIETQGRVNFSALHYTDEELMYAKHIYDLPAIKRPETILHLDYIQRGLGNNSCCGPDLTSLPQYSVQKGIVSNMLRLSPAHREIILPEYCKPTGTIEPGKQAFVKSIKSANAVTNLDFNTTTHPGVLYNVVPGEIKTEPGSKVNLQFVANNLGAYTEATTLNDLRYTYAAVFMDKNNDLKFTADELITTVGKRGTEMPRGGNMDVLNFQTEISVPQSVTPTTYRIRVIYDAATFTGDITSQACGPVTNGIVYDLNLRSAPREYCVPSGTFHSDKLAFVKEITSSGAESDFSYSTTVFPEKVYNDLPGSITTRQGGKFTLNLAGNVAGPETQVFQDLRYNVAAIYADWDGDGVLTEIGFYGKMANEGLDVISANYQTVLNISKEIQVPVDAVQGKSIIRVIYQNAWQDKAAIQPCMTTIKEGIAYDIHVDVLLQGTGTQQERVNAYQFYPLPASNILNIRGDFQAGSSIQIYNINGSTVKNIVINTDENFLQVDVSDLRPGIYFAKILKKDQTLFTGKIIKQ